jgi:1,4-dihydroxy-2-naphthoate octaprenyltransferase
MNPAHLMKTLALTCLATTGLLFVSSCETNNYDDTNRGSTTTTTTEETTLRTPFNNAPLSSTTETQTTRTY